MTWITIQNAHKIAASNLYCKITLVWLDSSLSVLCILWQHMCDFIFDWKSYYVSSINITLLISTDDQSYLSSMVKQKLSFHPININKSSMLVALLSTVWQMRDWQKNMLLLEQDASRTSVCSKFAITIWIFIK